MRKSVGQPLTAGEQTQQKLSDVFRHWSGTGESYCRTRSDVGSERVNILIFNFLCLLHVSNLRVHLQEDGCIYSYG